jgi:hypothetical protein
MNSASIYIDEKLLTKARKAAKRSGARSLNAFLCEAVREKVANVFSSTKQKKAA